MRAISIEPSLVTVLDEPGPGGACHNYAVGDFNFIQFQKGPVGENGINGCQTEDLLTVVIDRLQGFQSGDFSCRENGLALFAALEALSWLSKRTADRVHRGVEGINKK